MKLMNLFLLLLDLLLFIIIQIHLHHVFIRNMFHLKMETLSDLHLICIYNMFDIFNEYFLRGLNFFCLQMQLPPDLDPSVLQQLLNLTPEQLSLLPPDQQQQVMQLQQMLRQAT